jgi:hypothetical protein
MRLSTDRRVAVPISLLLLVLGVSGPPVLRAHEGHDTGPHPTATPARDPSAAAAAPAPVVFRVRPEARADLGWTGIAHDQGWPAEQRLGFTLDCNGGGDSCTATGGARGDFFGAPVALSSGGVPACIVNRLRTGVTGRVQPKVGCGELQLYLSSMIFLGEEVARPCPVCRDDATPNDGKRDGRCEGGAASGKPCDAHGTSTLFGATSNDCEPSPGKSAGELTIDLAPLTTGDAKLEAALTCKTGRGGKDAARCFCAAQVEANACTGGPCDASGHCPEGPLDGTCSLAPYRGCRPGTGREDCDAIQPGSGECRIGTRPCFRDTITARGRCDPHTPTYVAVFCVPQTRAAALNSAAGLPGPARLVLPLERLP